MKYVIKNKGTGENVRELVKFPSITPKVKLKKFNYDDLNIYIIVEAEKPEFDSNKSYLTKVEDYTVEKHPDYYDVFICNHTWQTNDYSKEHVIELLNNSLGVHLDAQYPIWERAKHAGEGTYILWAKSEGLLTQDQIDRKAYIDSVYNWITQCRADRDLREADFLSNDTFPSFIWTNRT